MSDTTTTEVWTWEQPRERHPDGLHVRWDRGELVVIATGTCSGSIAGRRGGVRLPREAAAALGRFLTTPPPHGEDRTCTSAI